MTKIKSKARVLEYSQEFKVMVINLTYLEGVQIKRIADCMRLHPLTTSTWRKEVRDGKVIHVWFTESANDFRIPVKPKEDER